MTAFEATQIKDTVALPDPGFDLGNLIWYRRKGETFIHKNYVWEIRGRVIRVHREPRGAWAPRNETEIWLDTAEIEVLEVQAPVPA